MFHLGRLWRRFLVVGALGLVVTAAVQAAQAAELGKVKGEKVVYHKVGELELTLDLYLPDDEAARRPAVVWIHGGAWRGGSPAQFKPQSQYLASQGLVCASVRYRLSGEAKFPACLNDVKGAVRFLRANADKYGIDPDRIAVGGGSAGGHLAAMVGTTPGKFEGDGPCQDVSSRANLLILFNPALDLVAMGEHRAVQGLFGTPSPSEKQLADASPISHVSKDVPPTLILHGDQDRTVPYSQAVAFRDALVKNGVKAELFTAKGKGHAWFNRGEDFLITLERVVEFLKANGFWRK